MDSHKRDLFKGFARVLSLNAENGTVDMLREELNNPMVLFEHAIKHEYGPMILDAAKKSNKDSEEKVNLITKWLNKQLTIEDLGGKLNYPLHTQIKEINRQITNKTHVANVEMKLDYEYVASDVQDEVQRSLASKSESKE